MVVPVNDEVGVSMAVAIDDAEIKVYLQAVSRPSYVVEIIS